MADPARCYRFSPQSPSLPGRSSSRSLGRVDIVQVVGWHFVIGGALLAIAASAVEGAPRFTWTPQFGLVVAFLALVGTALTFWAWFTETQRCRLGELTAWTFLTPLFGLAFGVILAGERPSTTTALGVAIVIAAMAVLVRPGANEPAAAA